MSNEFRRDLRAALVAGLLAGLSLTVIHAALWRWRRRFHRTLTYSLGLGAVLAAVWGWALARRTPALAGWVTLIAALSCSWVAVAWHWHWHFDAEDERSYPVLPVPTGGSWDGDDPEAYIN